MSRELQNWGGAAALVEALLYLLGFAAFLTLLSPPAGLGDGQRLSFWMANQTPLLVVNFLIYVVFGLALVVLVSALHARLRGSYPRFMPIVSAFGMLWAGLVIASGMIANAALVAVAELHLAEPERAQTLWLTLSIIQDALGGGNELLGGLWVILISAAAWQGRRLPMGLCVLGLVVGVCGLLTVVPTLPLFQDLFGLSQIVWFLWIGQALLRDDSVV